MVVLGSLCIGRGGLFNWDIVILEHDFNDRKVSEATITGPVCGLFCGFWFVLGCRIEFSVF